jgi:hypothetical protein
MGDVLPTVLTIGQEAYVPFWVLLDYDRVPRDPFRRVRLIALHLVDEQTLADVEIATATDSPPLIAYGLPLDYLISPSDLKSWAARIANWFTSYCDKAGIA